MAGSNAALKTMVEADSLAPVAKRLSELMGREVNLVRDWVDRVDIKPGELKLLENCRFNKGEKKDDDALARKYAALCDVYVNDAFGTAHRAEASTHGVARHAKVACAGPLLAAELDALGRALADPRRPLAAIVGGSKVSTKLTILKTLAQKVEAFRRCTVAHPHLVEIKDRLLSALCDPVGGHQKVYFSGRRPSHSAP